MNPDVVVIGGGIIGTCCAYYLAKEGVRVHLVERGPVARGASGACQLGVGNFDKGIGRELAQKSSQLYFDSSQELPVDIEYNQCGHILIADMPQKMYSLERKAQAMQGSGVSFELLNREQLLKIEPYVASDVYGGMFFPDNAIVHPILATIGFALRAEQEGATVQTFTEVTGIELSSGVVTAVNTTRGRIPCKAVVNAAGAWSSSIGQMVGIDIPVVPRKGHIVVTEPVPKLINSYLLDVSYLESVENEEENLSVEMVLGQTRSGNILLGSSRQFVGFDCNVDADVIQEIVRCCIRFMKSLENIHAIRSYAGLRPSTQDRLPIIDESDEIRGFYIATGHEGSGISMGPITGKLIAQLVTGQEPEVALHQLTLSRFS